MRLILATHTHEMKTALFLALNALSNVYIVATATSTGEMINYCRTLRPDVAVLEIGLPGQSLDEALEQLDEWMGDARILVIDGSSAHEAATKRPNVTEFSDIEVLIDACSVTDSPG